MKTININEIIIPDYMVSPSAEKLTRHINEYNRTHTLKPVVLTKDNMLKEGYISYLLAKQYSISEIPYSLSNKDAYKTEPTLYIYGVHPNNPKEYVWRTTKNLINYLKVTEGSQVLVNTFKGIQQVTVTRTEVLSTPPRQGEIKTVRRPL